MPFGWVFATIAAAGFQVARNGLQRSLVGSAGPRGANAREELIGGGFGLFSGLSFGFSLNAFRHAGLMLEPHHTVYAAILAEPIVQAMQSAGLGLILLLVSPGKVMRVVKDWRRSTGAGLCGAFASAGWFVALALAPAASVRAVGVIEAPMAAFAGHRLFKEHLNWRQWVAGLAVAGGVVVTALG